MESFGAWSVVPPILALALAISTRNVILSLGVGVLLGMTIHAGFDPWLGLVDFFERGILAQLSQGSNAEVAIIILVIGGFVHLLDRSGGMVSFAARMTRVVDSPLKAQLSVWLTGLAIFFTDSGNPLILGPMFRPIFAAKRICTEKLAFIIDSTSAPVCVLIPFISWGVYILSLMEKSFGSAGIGEEPLHALLSALPFQLYPLLALATVPLLALTGREYGPMARAQRRARLGQDDPPPPGSATGAETRASSRAVVLPLVTMLVVLFGLFALFIAQLGELPGGKVRLSLVLGYLSATAVCAALLSREHIFGLAESFRVFVDGMGRMVLIVLILLLAWSLGDVCELLGTGPFVARAFDHILSPGLLPAVVFVLGGLFALSTGSSWGTFALLMPIAIPVAHETGASLPVTLAAVLSGGIFGDHCSPVSDTTILSSMASGCTHADHVNTQLVYALTTGATAFVGFVVAGLTGFHGTIAIVLVLQVLITVGLTWFLGAPAHPR